VYEKTHFKSMILSHFDPAGLFSTENVITAAPVAQPTREELTRPSPPSPVQKGIYYLSDQFLYLPYQNFLFPNF